MVSLGLCTIRSRYLGYSSWSFSMISKRGVEMPQSSMARSTSISSIIPFAGRTGSTEISRCSQVMTWRTSWISSYSPISSDSVMLMQIIIRSSTKLVRYSFFSRIVSKVDIRFVRSSISSMGWISRVRKISSNFRRSMKTSSKGWERRG